MCLPNGGIAPKLRKVGIPRCVPTNGERVFASSQRAVAQKCKNRELVPLSDAIIYKHLSGKDGFGRDVVGLYPILPDDTCYFLAIDFAFG